MKIYPREERLLGIDDRLSRIAVARLQHLKHFHLGALLPDSAVLTRFSGILTEYLDVAGELSASEAGKVIEAGVDRRSLHR